MILLILLLILSPVEARERIDIGYNYEYMIVHGKLDNIRLAQNECGGGSCSYPVGIPIGDGTIPQDTSTTTTYDPCEGDFDMDGDVDGSDATIFKEDFGRSNYNEVCR